MQNSQAVKKSVTLRKAMVKKDVKSKVADKNQVVPNLPELSLLKFLPLTYHHNHFSATTLDFTFFFIIAFLRVTLFFYSLAVLD